MRHGKIQTDRAAPLPAEPSDPQYRRTRTRTGASRLLLLTALIVLLPACAALQRQAAMPSCANVGGAYNPFYNPDVPIGAERIGSRLWIERRLIYTSRVGSIVRAVAAGQADGQWEATRLATPVLVEDGLWKTTVATGLAGHRPFDINFDARAWPDPDLTTARIERRTVELYIHAFGPRLGYGGLKRTIRMAALKYRGAVDTDWAICPVRW